MCPSTSYPLLDTGQAGCYDDSGAEISCPAKGELFFGQDAQFSGTEFSFSDNGDGTVSDNNTGLLWQQIPAETAYSWADAQDYCWYVAFGYAVGPESDDVHGAGAVRFDTKVQGGPAGEEPERVYNYVRLVRDAGKHAQKQKAWHRQVPQNL